MSDRIDIITVGKRTKFHTIITVFVTAWSKMHEIAALTMSLGPVTTDVRKINKRNA